MNNRITGLAAGCFIAATLSVPALAQNTAMARRVASEQTAAGSGERAEGARDRGRQDGRFIQKLRWVSPHGELPGTYADYRARHPLTTARFSGEYAIAAPLRHAPPGPERAASTVSILVDGELYPDVQAGLDEYVADLIAEGYAVFLETVFGGTPADIKAWVQARYDSGSEQVVFVGDVTAAWAEVSGSVFPSDLFYMDLDGSWEDADQDGDYEIHTAGNGDEGPDISVARINAHTLDYDTEANMVNGYLAKAHAYRTGGLTQPWRGLEYVDEDWSEMYVALDLVYGGDVVRHDYGYFTIAADYLNQMDLGQHFAQPCVHSFSGGHCFGTRPTESVVYSHVYVHSPSARSAKLLLGSDDGIKVWLNGDNVCTQDVYQGWQPDQFSVDVTLNEGWNRLLCKISQGAGAYSFSARLADVNLESFPDLGYQINDPDTHNIEPPFIRGWLLNGFHQDSSDNFWDYLSTNYLGVAEETISPLEGQDMGDETWTAFSAASSFVDLGAYSGDTDFGACYAFVRVYADVNKTCQLWLGYDDGARVWLNGQEVLLDNRYGGFEQDMSKIDVALNVGENRLLIKVSEWMGTHGFSARFCQSDGTTVDGLTCDPAATPISYLGDWLLNGPYLNPDGGTRLSEDYLGGEAGVRPSEGDTAPFGTWERGVGSGYPFDIGSFYDHGTWVYSQDIQDRDPPVLFYNLFACGPGRFTDDNYLAGAYIFNTTYGLITVASAKSGSMLNFADFTDPLGRGRTIGAAFREWFDAQAPFEMWEREWYYGMILNGDPTLRPVRAGDMDRDGDVDADDFVEFVGCFTGPGGGPIGPECAPGDSDADGDVDCEDWKRFVLAWTGPGDLPEFATCVIGSPLPAPSPHDTPKNRYISFDPGHTENVAFQVELTASTAFPGSIGVFGWVGEPNGNAVSRLVDEAFFGETWPAVVHVGDCAIVPATTYEIRTTNGIALSDPLVLSTTPEPTPKKWGDVVGEFEVAAWTEPNGVVNMDDVMAAVQRFKQLPNAPHLTWIDVDGQMPNVIVNMTDIFQIVQGFKGEPYSFSDPAECP